MRSISDTELHDVHPAAARILGCAVVAVRTGWHVVLDVEERYDYVADNLLAAARWILAFTGRPNKPLQPASGADALG
jgi:hypothetical protein